MARAQQAADGVGETLYLATRMRTEAASVQTLLYWWWHKMLLGESEVAFRGLRFRTRYAAPHPEQPCKVYASCRRGLGVQRVGYVDPCTNLTCTCDLSKKGESQGRSPRAFGAGNLSDRAQRQAACQQLIDAGNPR
jgi:hypothetical protein